MDSAMKFFSFPLCLFLSGVFTEVASLNVGYFWHVTDFHYDHTYWTSGLSCNDEVPVKGQFGDYWCDSPWELVLESVREMARVKADVDFLIWTGDSVAHIKDANLTLETNLEVMQNVTTVLNDSFPNTSIYASLGNHDFYPNNQASAEMEEMYNRVSDMWGSWIEGTAQRELFKKGGYYIQNIGNKTRLVALNTNLYFSSNRMTRNITDPAGQLEWLRGQLEGARQNGEKVMITGHVPVGVFAPGLTEWFYPEFTGPFLDLIVEYADVIIANHFGHNHGDGFVVLQKEVGAQMAVPQFMAPSVTPWRFKIPGLTGAAHNPAVRLVKYDRDTGLNLDYDQYFMNLTQGNQQGSPTWKKLYTFTEAYKVNDMSVASLRSIFDKMKSQNSEEGQKFCNFHLVSEFDKPCTSGMRADIHCAGTIPYLEKAKDCAMRYVNAASRLAGGFRSYVTAATIGIVYSAVMCFL
ncbi:acid sphingomyelinase-like phosphodiesterase 3b [Aplysia californica]|uniref:Acid sphingomyelinase-like phosphodiesterase 3b n=1 Tax=Aplysia californica TaxID=6500 RepID=A0ABM0JJH3_APLCA|nr:acid sphingomyelinase-like phosphodiesterase 3b [Aplysia californica]